MENRDLEHLAHAIEQARIGRDEEGRPSWRSSPTAGRPRRRVTAGAVGWGAIRGETETPTGERQRLASVS